MFNVKSYLAALGLAASFGGIQAVHAQALPASTPGITPPPVTPIPVPAPVGLGVAVVVNEILKCEKGIGVPGGCVGPNGEGAKAIRVIGNGLRDLFAFKF